jgi:hypothetical protein
VLQPGYSGCGRHASQVAIRRHQLNSWTVGNVGRLVFVGLYRSVPTVLLKIIQSETVIGQRPLPHRTTFAKLLFRPSGGKSASAAV